MVTTFIYALCEPHSRTVRYIGKANDPKKRFKDHLKVSVRADTYLGNWLRGLLSLGEKPVLAVLREVPQDQWQIAEERYIRLARGLGMRLTNATDGGEGQVNPTPETRFKIGKAHRGKPLSEATRALIRSSTSGSKNHKFGHKVSEETRCKISIAKLGCRHSEESKEKIRAKMKVRFFSEEHRTRISEGLRQMHALRKAAKV